MPERRHEAEAEKILAQIGSRNRAAARQTRRILAEALERAERRGREMLASLKESSG
ncbi:hypothetical protein [Microvirga pakistanensis]|uniref:hypothetical protein n=1 Tax=Microvirga pakistanensis TaxID=1682650 RepID=UPI00141B4766|nr:hypothetical protein [Microvirga pakistanensis]